MRAKRITKPTADIKPRRLYSLRIQGEVFDRKMRAISELSKKMALRSAVILGKKTGRSVEVIDLRTNKVIITRKGG